MLQGYELKEAEIIKILKEAEAMDDYISWMEGDLNYDEYIHD